jgi:hypothetical protein
VDDIITMSTCKNFEELNLKDTGNFTLYLQAIKKGVDEIGIKKLQTGLMIVHSQTNRGFNETEINMRMNEIVKNKIRGIAMWRTHPVLHRTSYWWHVFNKFLSL